MRVADGHDPATRSAVNNEKRLLVVSWTFPPSSDVGGKRIARFCKYLPQFGWTAEVLTATPKTFRRLDYTFVADPSPGIHTVGEWKNPLDYYKRFRERFRRKSSPASNNNDRPVSAKQPFHSGKEKLLKFFATPDDHVYWYPQAVGKGKKLMKQQRFTAILSSGPPWTCHLVALKLKRIHDLPWVIDFRDPWIGNKVLAAPAILNRLETHWEQACVEAADAVVCNNELLREHYLKRFPGYPAEKFVTITNGLDDSPLEFREQPRMSAGPKTLLHIGSIYLERENDFLFQALRRLKAKGTPVCLVQVGPLDPRFAANVQSVYPDLVETAMVRFEPEVDWLAAQNRMRAADALLILQGPYRMQVPAKFYEYVAAHRPVLALAHEGALTRLLAESGAGFYVNPDDPVAIASGIERVISLEDVKVNADWLSRFHFRELTARLASTLNAVSAKA